MTDVLDGSQLCTSCGLCCDGTLFTYAELRRSEWVLAGELGLRTKPSHPDVAERALDLPCRALKDCRCTVYARRPTICRSFRCQLLERYVAGGISLDEATKVVTAAKRLRDDFRAKLKVGPGESLQDTVLAAFRNGQLDKRMALAFAAMHRQFEKERHPLTEGPSAETSVDAGRRAGS